MRRATALMGAALVFFATAATAQEKSNSSFTGKWTLDAEKTAAANPAPQGGAPGRGMGGPVASITFDAASLTTERQGRDGAAMQQVFKLDGSETTLSMGQMSGKATAKWEGNTVVVTTTIETPNGARTTKAVYAIEGDLLVVTSTRPGQNGEVTTKAYYKKS